MSNFYRKVRTFSGALVATLLIAFLQVMPAHAASYTANNEATLDTAIANAQAGDTVTLTSDIVITARKTLSRAIIFDGGQFTLTVPTPGINEDGSFATSPSTFGVITVQNTGIEIRNLTIKGGYNTNGAISVGGGYSATFNQVTISNSRSIAGGGGLYNQGTSYINNSNISKNSGQYGGGIYNSGTLIAKGTSFTDNRSESSGGGGGAAENGGTMYLNNCTMANNQSTEIGGGVNNYMGTMYVFNSTFTGNVAYGSYGGGAIGKNGGTVQVYNSLFAYNYKRTGGDVSNPTAYVLDDLGYNAVPVYYSIYHSATSVTANSSNLYTGAADGSDNSIFAGGANTKITSGTGAQIGTATVFRPSLLLQNGRYTVPLKANSWAIGKGTATRFGNTSTSVRSAYSVAGAWTAVNGVATSSDDVLTDQLGVTRDTTAQTPGSLSGTSSVLYTVKSIQASGGQVSGATAYGDNYSSGTSVTVTALPNSGQQFTKWSVVVGTAAAVDVLTNPYTFTVTNNVTVTPVFSAAVAGTYSVTYSGNSNTGGTPPAVQSVSGGSSVTISANTGALIRTGYDFGGWNTLASGAGTNYAVGSTQTPSANVTLYAKWIAPVVPSLSYSSASASLTVGQVANIAAPSNSGGTPSSWSVSPGLPAGLSLSSSSGAISGTPSSAQVASNYSVTATNASGSSSATISITVLSAGNPPSISYSTVAYSFETSVAATIAAPSNSGDAIVSYAVSPALPSGLSLNSSTGVISGTPTVVQVSTSYAITATNLGGSSSANISITITSLPAPMIAYANTVARLTQGAAISLNAPLNTGGTPATWSISPSLPSGLSLNTSTGVISGTPTATQSSTNYTVTATNATGATSDVLSIEIVAQAQVITLPPAPIVLAPLTPIVKEVTPGTIQVSEGNSESKVILDSQSGASSLDVSSDTWKLSVKSYSSANQPIPLDSEGRLILLPGQSGTISGSGYKANSEVQVFIFSNPIFLGAFKTDSDGKFIIDVKIPGNLEFGNHTLQILGYSPSGSIRQMSLGVIAKAPTVKFVGYFKQNVKTLNTSNIARLNAWFKVVETQGSVSKLVVTVTVQGSQNDYIAKTFATQRFTQISKILRASGYSGIISSKSIYKKFVTGKTRAFDVAPSLLAN